MAARRYFRGDSVTFVSNRLLSSLGPWAHEINDLHRPWRRAITELCASGVERLLRACAITLVSSAGDAGSEAIQAFVKGKPIAAMEIDHLVELFERIDSVLTGKLKSQYALPAGQDHLLSHRDLRLLHKLSKMSRGAGGRPSGPEGGNRRVLDLLSCAAELCQSSLVATARAVEAKNRRH